MRNHITRLSLLAICLLAVGCKTIKVEDGKIPNDYIIEAQKYVGSYSGAFEGRDGKLDISLEGNTVHLQFLDGKNNDILGDECSSQLGLLQEITVSGSKKNPILDRAAFALDPAKCSDRLLGRSVNLYFSHQGTQLNVAILHRTESVYRCEPGGPVGGAPRCNYETEYRYLRGRFQR